MAPTGDDWAGAVQSGDDAPVAVSPVFVLSRNFPARPSSIPDAHEFVRTTLRNAAVEAAPHSVISQAIISALYTAASPEIGTFVVVIRLFPEEAEIEVLSAADPAAAWVTGKSAVRSPVAEDEDSFAMWLEDVLRREGISQEQAARQLGVSVRTVSRWVRGQTEPRMRDLRRISETFGPVPHA
jgi:DNA-binding XRE family transcriptional regulator